MKRWSTLALVVLMLGMSQACLAEAAKPRIVVTMFPTYDMARAVAGEYADLSLLLPVGVESHSYEPTPADIITIGGSDLFIYTGEHMEVWVHSLLAGIPDPRFTVLDVSQGIVLGEAEHEHDDEDEVEHEEEAGHDHDVDPHIWTDPNRAKIMVENIRDALCAYAPEYAEIYTANAAAYLTELDALDVAIREAVSQAKHTDLVFGGRFALHYFCQRYGLNAVSAYDSCSTETEPSVRQVLDLIKMVREKGLPVVYFEELTDPKVAETIAQETGTQMLLMHTCHNVSREDFERGVSYLELMWNNLENLKVGLGV